ncbi:hypothetical protein ACKWTF_002716 [Chironomus riparius]
MKSFVNKNEHGSFYSIEIDDKILNADIITTPLWLRDQVIQNNRMKIDRQKEIPYLKIVRKFLFYTIHTLLKFILQEKDNELKLHKETMKINGCPLNLYQKENWVYRKPDYKLFM